MSSFNNFLLLYGSQTGQAEAIAESIAESALAEELEANLQVMSGIERKVCIVCTVNDFMMVTSCSIVGDLSLLQTWQCIF